MDVSTSSKSTLTWFLQRITGLLLVVFLFTHMNINHLSLGERIIDFSLVNSRLAGSFGWKVFYIMFVPACAFHAMNGLWGILIDYRPSAMIRKASLAVLWLIGLALTYIGADTLINLFEA